MKYLKRNTILILLILIITMGVVITICSSCRATMPYEPARDVWKCENTIQELGRYDTSAVIKKDFLHGRQMIVYLLYEDSVIIWGRKCDFQPGEMLYAEGQYWASIHKCKYFLTNDNSTIRYTLLKRQ